MLSGELLSGSDSTRRDDTLALVRRALALLPAGHGHVGARFDSGFYRIELLRLLRRRRVSFSISVPRSSAMWKALEAIGEDDWSPGVDFPGAEVAEAARGAAANSTDTLRATNSGAWHWRRVPRRITRRVPWGLRTRIRRGTWPQWRLGPKRL